MVQPWQIGKVVGLEQENATTRRFWIELPALTSFDFEPGQFVTIDLPIDEKPSKRWRSYSIASWPDGSNVFELVIVLLERGTGTEFLFNHVHVGTELTLRGAQGVFTLPEKIDRDLFFICTGTGVAPFRSMVHHILNHKIAHQNIYLIFGCRKFSDCLYREELTELEKKLDGFYYLPVFSREMADDINKLVRIGYVHSIYEEILKNGLVSADLGKEPVLKPAYFFLCGWKNMIAEAKQRITALGYEKKNIHQELYG